MTDALRLAFLVVLVVCGVIWWNDHTVRQDTRPVAVAPRVDTIIQSVPEIRTVVRRQTVYQRDTTFVPVTVPPTVPDGVVVRPDTMVYGLYVADGDTTPTLTHPSVAALLLRTEAARDTLGQAFARLDTAVAGLQQARTLDRELAREATRKAQGRGQWQGLALGVVTALVFAWVAK